MTFHEFFSALWPGRNPFPWQEMLAHRDFWPEAIDLPTASGKTACMDAAIYRLATGLYSSGGHPMPRRIWFVVDRRIVVDEAFRRASRIAEALQNATGGPLKEVADKLRSISGTGVPLAVARMRGGTWRDDHGWASDPRQPAIICTTVDQIGSSLLFSAYGHGDRTASVYAGLAGNDSLIILDEAHCSEPFRQTLDAIERFRRDPWSPEPPPVPFAYTIMSATLPKELRDNAFPFAEERPMALAHPALIQRRDASKRATLHLVPKSTSPDSLVDSAKEAAQSYRNDGRHRIAIMVNRVATAKAIFDALAGDEKLHQAVLITGRMRPLDRDNLVQAWSPHLESDSTTQPENPIILVTTQCLEVGADFSFDALVTECASLDSLRQRFGRLDRLGHLGATKATILLRADNNNEPGEKDADPIYGKAIYHTWTWLNEVAELDEESAAASPTAAKGKKKAKAVVADGEPKQPPTKKVIDFGIGALGAKLSALQETDEQVEGGQERLPQMLAPQPDAPILMPGHLDLLCQTGPRPSVEPDISLYLHGKERTSAEVRVVFRCDFDPNQPEDYLSVLPLLPPTSPEGLSVPLHRLKQWLMDQKNWSDPTGDVEGEADPLTNHPTTGDTACSPFVRWRGRNKSRVVRAANALRAGDVIVLPASPATFKALGQAPENPDGAGAAGLDLAEMAMHQAKGRVVIRLHREVWEPWLKWPKVKTLLQLASEPGVEREDLLEAITAVVDEQRLARRRPAEGEDAPSDDESNERSSLKSLPGWLFRLLVRVRRSPNARAPKSVFPFAVEHTPQGAILTGKQRFRQRAPEADPFDEDDCDERSRSQHTEEVKLLEHTAQVRQLANAFAASCWPTVADDMDRAAFSHDLGKLDPRFQAILRGGDPLAFDDDPLAKSTSLPTSRRLRDQVEHVMHLPSGFRHEMLSAQIAEHLHLAHSEMALHLITSHHGHSRPFAPVVEDTIVDQESVGDLLSERLGLPAITAETRSIFGTPHDLGSGHADRFWMLTRKHGWWGLAYAEMLLRMADWEASRKPQPTDKEASMPPDKEPAETGTFRTSLDLPGIDGTNPLGALAALGVLRTLNHAWPKRDVRLHWKTQGGSWKAVISIDGDLSMEEPTNDMITAIASVLKLGFKAKSTGHEKREEAQHELEAVDEQIKQVKAYHKKRKLKGADLEAARLEELEPLEGNLARLKAATIDPTDTAKNAFDTKRTEIKAAVTALKTRKLKGVQQKAERAKLVEPLEIQAEQLRLAWLQLLKDAVPFPEMALGKRVDVPVAEYQAVARETLREGVRWPMEMLTHFGSDGCVDDGATVSTPLSFINGSGHQFFLETATELTKCVTPEKLRLALLHTWFPEDEKHSMRWLPSEDRRYALMASNPSGGEKALTVWAANLLGYAGLGLLPSAPQSNGLATTSIVRHQGEPAFRWPIWEAPLGADAVTSLFAQHQFGPPVAIHRRSMRIEVGDGANKKVNFTPSVAC